MKSAILSVFVLLFFTMIFSQELFSVQASADALMVSYKASLDTIKDYTCILHEYVGKGNKHTDNYWYYKFMLPKYIRMESFKGDRKGSKAFYDYKTKKVTGRQGGVLAAIKLTLDLSNGLVKNIRGITIAESDWIFVYDRTMNILKEPGISLEISDTKFKGENAKMIHIKNFSADKYRFDETIMFFSEENILRGFYNYEDGEIVEDIYYYDIKLNTGMPLDSLYVK